MIAFVNGNFVTKLPSQVIVDVNGVGYDLQISLNTYSAISKKESGRLLTYLHVTENGHTLYGFYDQEEKDLFVQLISVSGVGTSTARMMLSGLKPDEIISSIVNSNTKQLESVKGIGKKTAERIVVELRDKLADFAEGPAKSTTEMDVLSALENLGYPHPVVEAAIHRAMDGEADAPFDVLFKRSLQILTKG